MFLRDFDSGWLERFWLLYQRDREFRLGAEAFYRIGKFQQHQERVRTKLPGRQEEVSIDGKIADAIWTLNAQGFFASGACAGGAGSRAYVMAEHLPPELEQVAQAAGFGVTDGIIRTVVPMTQPAAAEAVAEDFTRLLNDWATGKLGASSHYAGWQQAIRQCSLIPLPQSPRPRQRASGVAQLIKKSLQGKATFQDFAKLKSGRDAFSRASEGNLLDELGLSALPGLIAILEGGDVRKALRWMCRGLPEGLALRKVSVDNALTERAREKSKRAQEAVEPGG